VRFHPAEIVLSMGWKMVVVAALGAPALAVAVFETGFTLFALWTHSNLALHVGVERVVRKIIVTPNLHRIHHSVLPHETNSNYGTALTAWDRLFGTYRCASRDPQESMTIGLAEWQDDRPARLGFSLLLPFARR
jgi:sterol desaturase/sphingolipid hydroxylase (fatty acid hydroxylase superfamily)